MFNKLAKSFAEFRFYLRRSFGSLPNENRLRLPKQGIFWLVLLTLQGVLGLKLLETLGGKVQDLFSVHQKRVSLEKTIEQTVKDGVQIKRSPQAVEKILGSLPTANENYNLLEKLNLSAANNRVGLLEVSFLQSRDSSISGLLEQPVEIKIQGTFKDVFGFLDELENDQRPTFTENLNLETKENNLSSGYVRVKAVLRTYFTDFH